MAAVPPQNGQPAWRGTWAQVGALASSAFGAALLALVGINAKLDSHEARLAEFERDRREWMTRAEQQQREILERQRSFVDRALQLDTLLKEVLRLLKERR